MCATLTRLRWHTAATIAAGIVLACTVVWLGWTTVAGWPSDATAFIERHDENTPEPESVIMSQDVPREHVPLDPQGAIGGAGIGGRVTFLGGRACAYAQIKIVFDGMPAIETTTSAAGEWNATGEAGGAAEFLIRLDDAPNCTYVLSLEPFSDDDTLTLPSVGVSRVRIDGFSDNEKWRFWAAPSKRQRFPITMGTSKGARCTGHLSVEGTWVPGSRSGEGPAKWLKSNAIALLYGPPGMTYALRPQTSSKTFHRSQVFSVCIPNGLTLSPGQGDDDSVLVRVELDPTDSMLREQGFSVSLRTALTGITTSNADGERWVERFRRDELPLSGKGVTRPSGHLVRFQVPADYEGDVVVATRDTSRRPLSLVVGDVESSLGVFSESLSGGIWDVLAGLDYSIDDDQIRLPQKPTWAALWVHSPERGLVRVALPEAGGDLAVWKHSVAWPDTREQDLLQLPSLKHAITAASDEATIQVTLQAHLVSATAAKWWPLGYQTRSAAEWRESGHIVNLTIDVRHRVRVSILSGGRIVSQFTENL